MSVAQKGATLVKFTKEDDDIIVPFDPDFDSQAFNGAILAPFNNRVRDGEYSYQGQDFKLEINDVGRHNAMHGLIFNQLFDLKVLEEDRIVLTYLSKASKGYPWDIFYDVQYKLSKFGLKLVIKVYNQSENSAPFSIGWHPWFNPHGKLDDCALYFKHGGHWLTDEQLIPVGKEKASKGHDFNKKKELVGLDLDDTYCELFYSPTHQASAFFKTANGPTNEIWIKKGFDGWQVCSANHIDGFERQGLAIEPVSAPADAFNSKDQLIILEPQEKNTFICGIHPLPY